MANTTTERPSGFDEALWNNLTERQRRHIVDAVGDVEVLLQGDESDLSALAMSVYSQCWLAMKRTMFVDGVLTTQVTLEQMDALEQYVLTGLVQTMRAMIQKGRDDEAERN